MNKRTQMAKKYMDQRPPSVAIKHKLIFTDYLLKGNYRLATTGKGVENVLILLGGNKLSSI